MVKTTTDVLFDQMIGLIRQLNKIEHEIRLTLVGAEKSINDAQNCFNTLVFVQVLKQHVCDEIFKLI